VSQKSPRRDKAKRAPSASDLTRTDALLAQVLLYLMGDAGQKKKALALRNANLSNAEIAGLMGTSPEVIGSVLYQARREHGSRRSRRGPSRRRQRRPKR
jgi:hypothetical protein